ncbi:MAG: hypothetical protein R3336_08580, partial [Phycisphaeraceae bacterium]|nr:hypothetical protein [Phycisphaeraceae bacterium]
AWIYLGSLSARVARRIDSLTRMMDIDPEAAEREILKELNRRPLQRWVRLLLYHRLALIRVRQQRFADTAGICAAVLAQPLGPAQPARPHLLLMSAEARLQLGDAWGAWACLMEMGRQPHSLTERLQALLLQLRYELAIGRPDAALAGWETKLDLLELLPVPQMLTGHVLLERAARARDQYELAQWLSDRVELMGGEVEDVPGAVSGTYTGEPVGTA